MSAPGIDENTSASVVLGATRSALAVATEGVETSSVPSEFRSEVCEKDRSLEYSGNGGLFYGTDLVIGSLLKKMDESQKLRMVIL